MTRTPAAGLLLPSLLLALSGCAETGTTGTAGATLTETYWALLEVDGNSFPEYQGTREPHIVFGREGERASGFAGCNAMAGGYETAGESLRVGPLVLTRMACLGADAMSMESAFVRGLEQTASYRIDGAKLELRDTAGTARVRLEARGTPR